MDRSEEMGFGESGGSLTNSFLWAATVFSLVPFLGIIFVPITFSIAAAAMIRGSEERSRARIAAIGAVVILAIQLMLWWLLYLIPEIGL